MCFLFAAFAVLLCVGLQMPCLALRLNLDALYEPNGPVPLSMKPTVEMFHLAEITRADVSMWGCVTSLTSHAMNGGGPNEFIALTLYAVFVIAFTVFDMFALVISAFQLHLGGCGKADDTKHHVSAMAVSHVLKKLSMMDVALVGITIVVCCGNVYKKQGIALYARGGLLLLYGAELCHYLAHFLVMSAAPPPHSAQVAIKQSSAVEK